MSLKRAMSSETASGAPGRIFGETDRRLVVAASAFLLAATPIVAGEAEADARGSQAVEVRRDVLGNQAEAVAPEAGVAPWVEASAASGDSHCEASATVMCLQEDRYAVTLEWETTDGRMGPAKVAKPRTESSGLFYFFDPGNWEVLLKVLDGCVVNKHHWVFAAAATDVGFKLIVTDTTLPADDDGVVGMRTYTKEPGSPAPALTATDAFPDACEASGQG